MPFILNGIKCYSSEEAADKMKVTASYMARQAKQGRVVAIKFRGNYFFTDKGLIEWQTNRKKPGRPRKVTEK